MRFPYYSPNFGLLDLLRVLFTSATKAEGAILEYYKQITGKNYAFLTNSCRTALYLAYQALGKQGEVITSPLTCKVAIDPIVESGNKPIYADITIDDLNINPKDIENRITNNTIAIQAIHLGGVSCNMDRIGDIAMRSQLIVIEDCAQSLGSYYKDKHTGSFGDIACFSLIKNAYGIGGGVFATNNLEVYKRALSINKTFSKPSKVLFYYRAIRNIFDTYRFSLLGQLLYEILIMIKGSQKSFSSIKNQLKQISSIEKCIASIQLKKYEKLHNCRQKIGGELSAQLQKENLMFNKSNPYKSSFSKFFIYNPQIKSLKHISELHKLGVEVMHLEQSKSSPVQDWLVDKNIALSSGLKNYAKVHNHILSIPITERYGNDEIDEITNTLIKALLK
jgi:dTDP-4-amino-4,6-dideoxygalactose transaminase